MDWEPVITAAPIVVAGVVAWWGYRRSIRVDAVSEKSGVATETRAGTAQIIDGLNSLVDQLQEGTASHRETIKFLTERIDRVLAENVELRLDNARLRKRYGVNGENGVS